MTEEIDILKILADNPSISQRKIAEQTGISLGQVNFLIKKCVKKGLIKIDGQTSKSIRYNLTPKGIAEKTARTLQYIKISYGAVVALTDKIKTIVSKYESVGKDIYFYGEEDEMMEIVKLALGHVKLLKSKPTDNAIILYWDKNKIDKILNEFELNENSCINILE